jgi:hypothetical protein
MAYVKTIWSTGDTITATLANHGETQYDEAKADLDTHVAAADPHPQYKLDTDAPNAHKASHATGGTDALTPADIGAVNKAGDTMTGALTVNDVVTASGRLVAKNGPVDANGGIEVGRTDGTAGTPYIDFHTGANVDYDVRIIVSGSATATGTGTGSINIISNSVTINANKVWHAGNDGAGSTMDADTVDGKHASDFVLVANAAKVAYGTYTGDGTTSRFIDVGFTPKLVKVYPNEGNNDYMLFINTTTGGKVMEIAWNVTYESLYTTNNLSSDLSIWGKLVTSGFNTSSASTSLHGNKSNIIYFWEAIG